MNKYTLINKRQLQYLFGGVILLVVANIFNNSLGKPYSLITRLIYMELDNNIPAWYSSILLAVAGLTAWECSVYAKRENISDGYFFLILAGLLFFMSCDEVARFHEQIGGHVAGLFNLKSKFFARHADWVWVGGPFIIIVFIGFTLLLKNLFSLVPNSIRFLSTGFFLIILGGIVIESSVNFLNHQEMQWLWEIEILVEESLEMLGTLFIAYSLLLWRDGIRPAE